MSYTFTPKRNIRRAASLSLTFFVMSVGLFAYANLISPDSKALFQLIGTVLGTAAIFILVKFIIISYVYEVDGDDLRVVEVMGKKRTTLALISISSVVAIADKSEKSKKLYNFCLELFPARTLVLDVEDGDGSYQIKLSYDEELEKIIKDKREKIKVKSYC